MHAEKTTHLTMTIETCGNPDFGQDPRKPFVPAEVFHPATLREASATLRDFCDRNNVGSGNLCAVYVERNGGRVARISYNGRVWPPAPWHPDMKPLSID